MSTNVKIVLFFLALFAALDFSINYQLRKLVEENKKLSLSGVILAKVKNRAYNIHIKNKYNKYIILHKANSDLYDYVVVGDSIVKLSGENKCLVIRKNDVKTFVKCYDDL